MKVLIISTARCGSTSLMKNIAKEKNLKPIFEPFNFRQDNKTQYTTDLDDVVVKTLVGQYPHSSDTLDINGLVEWESWICEFIKEFDEVILLTRKNLNAAAESFSVASYSDDSWFDSYVYKELPNLELSKKHLYYTNRFLFNVFHRTKIPVQYYEDIFDENSKDRLRVLN